MALAQENKLPVVATASTGNAAAVGQLSRRVCQRGVIFVLKTAPGAKIAQLLVYGTVLTVDGSAMRPLISARRPAEFIGLTATRATIPL
ncbi:MAG: hypothetical protein R2911_32425 [Caldilineaceae bacterium]